MARSRGVSIGVHYWFLGAISESCVVVGDQCSCPHPSWRECTADKFTKVLLLSEPQLHQASFFHNLQVTTFLCREMSRVSSFDFLSDSSALHQLLGAVGLHLHLNSWVADLHIGNLLHNAVSWSQPCTGQTTLVTKSCSNHRMRVFPPPTLGHPTCKQRWEVNGPPLSGGSYLTRGSHMASPPSGK